MTQLLAPQLMELQKQSMKEKNKLRTATLRSISAAFKQILVDEKRDALTRDEEINVLKKMLKQRVESAHQFNIASRPDLEEKELAEIEIIDFFVPKQLTVELMEAEVDLVLSKIESPTMADMGKIMGQLQHLKSTADLGKMSGMVREKLKKL